MRKIVYFFVYILSWIQLVFSSIGAFLRWLWNSGLGKSILVLSLIVGGGMKYVFQASSVPSSEREDTVSGCLLGICSWLLFTLLTICISSTACNYMWFRDHWFVTGLSYWALTQAATWLWAFCMNLSDWQQEVGIDRDRFIWSGDDSDDTEVRTESDIRSDLERANLKVRQYEAELRQFTRRGPNNHLGTS